PVIHNRIQARGTNLLARILKSYPADNDAIRMVYLRTLARKPTNKELAKCQAYIKKTDNRAEAYEDILWALINSTEFQTKRYVCEWNLGGRGLPTTPYPRDWAWPPDHALPEIGRGLPTTPYPRHPEIGRGRETTPYPRHHSPTQHAPRGTHP